jgi:hypothetical protein
MQYRTLRRLLLTVAVVLLPSLAAAHPPDDPFDDDVFAPIRGGGPSDPDSSRGVRVHSEGALGRRVADRVTFRVEDVFNTDISRVRRWSPSFFRPS